MHEQLATSDRVTFKFSEIGQRLAIQSVQVDALGLSQTTEYVSHNTARKHLRDGLADYAAALAEAFLENMDQGRHRRRFLKRFGALVLEDLLLTLDQDGLLMLTLKVAAGGTNALFAEAKAEKSEDSLSDVFLPLTNLSAYLRAVSDMENGSSNPSVALTADRIDEFLLAYGRRLQGGADVTYLTA